jgi:hypothetical protein
MMSSMKPYHFFDNILWGENKGRDKWVSLITIGATIVLIALVIL